MTEPADMMPEVLHAIGVGVGQLRRELAETEALRADEYSRAEWSQDRIAETEQRLKDANARLAEARDELARRQRSDERQSANLAQLDKLTLELAFYIMELAGHRDTAKTKAERVALGHVVERLKQIRGWDPDREGAA